MEYLAPHDQQDCGLSCLRMIAKHYGREYSNHYLRKISYIGKQGVSLYNLGKAAEKIGFKTLIGELSENYLVNKAPLPCILYWDKSHFVVLYKIKVNKKYGNKYYIADPGVGKVTLDHQTFLKYWISEKKGFALFLEPNHEVSDIDTEERHQGKKNIYKFIGSYFLKFKRNYLQILVSMLAFASITLIPPFLTQSIVDYGINQKNLNFIIIISSFQLVLFISNTFIDIIKSNLLLHVGSRINLSILNDFLYKMMRLPISFFESKLTGDIMQRLNDHQRIENFITNTLLSTLFSTINLIIFLFILAFYNIYIMIIFLTGSFISVLWTLFFMNWRKSLDYKRFRELSNSGDKLFELVNGISEIKLNNFESYKRQEWHEIQIRLFKVNVSNLSMEQYQKIGTNFIDQIKLIAITLVSANLVITGNLTFGMMLAISYIIGQMNVPVKQFSDFLITAQLAKIGIERMNEVYEEHDEENEDNISDLKHSVINNYSADYKTDNVIEIKNVSFQYGGDESETVLDNISFTIPKGKVTAIVGSSGSGKTTLLKLLLNFFPPTLGKILINNKNLNSISPAYWRSKCGVVMQDGFLFSDTILKNIVMGDEFYNIDTLIRSVNVANISEMVEQLPLHFNTKIGASGMGLSTGQKQRLLIARAVYKNPDYLFFDEATSALDAKNERIIIDNLNKFFEGRTVVVIAHRLSTVKNADQIIVLEKGKVVEVGSHVDLVYKEGVYFDLVKNQLELGSE